MSSGLGSVGFADGFVNGFGMVDQALQRRRANEIENKKIEQDQANNLATLDFRNKELGLQGEKNTNDANYNRDHLALTKSNNEASQLHDTNTLQASINQYLAQNKLTSQSNANQANYQNKALDYAQQNQVRDDDLSASIERRSVAVHDMEIEQKTLELEAAKKGKKKQEDLIDLSNSIYTNADGSPAFHLKNGADGIKQLKQFESSGINLVTIAANTHAYTQYVENIKTALMDPSPGTKQKAIAGLNVTEKIDINQGLGKQADGTTVTSKEISDVIQHPPEAGYPDGYYSFAIKSIGTDAQGNPQVRDGDPMTQYRSSSAYDQNVQRVTPEQLTNRVATQENLINFVNSNPKLQQQIIKLHHEAMPKDKDGTKSVIYRDNYDSNTGVNTKTPDSIFDNKAGTLTPIAGQSSRETEIQKKASIVLQNPQKFSKEQVDYANQVLKNSQ